MTRAQQPVRSNRRDSAIFLATPAPRPSSAMSSVVSDSDSTVKKHDRKTSFDRPSSSASVSRPSAALVRSSRANSASNKTGSTAPPVAGANKPRSSITSTPQPTKTARSSSSSPHAISPTGTPLPARKVSSTVSALEQRAASSSARSVAGRSPGSRVTSPAREQDEKENVAEAVGLVSARKRVLVPS